MSIPSLFAATGEPTQDWFNVYADKEIVQPENQFKIDPDLWQRWIANEEYTPETIDLWRNNARGGQLKEWYSFMDEMPRTAVSTQLQKLRDHVCDATYQLLENPREAREGFSSKSKGGYEKPVDQDILDISHRVHDWIEDTVMDKIPELNSGTGVDGDFYGISGAVPHFETRGYYGRWERLTELEQTASRRYRWYIPTRSFEIFGDSGYSKPYSVPKLVANGQLLFYEGDKHKHLDQRGKGWMVIHLWAIAQYVIRYWAETVQDDGKPIFWASYPQGNKFAERKAKAAIDRLAHDLRVALPNTIDLKLLQGIVAGRTSAGGAHQQLLEFVYRTLDQILLAHSHASGEQVGAGGKTAGAKASEDTIRMVNSLLRRLARWNTEQLIYPMVVRAVGPILASVVTPSVTAKCTQTPDYREESQTVANLVKAGQKLPPAEVATRTGYSVVQDGEPWVGEDTVAQFDIAPAGPDDQNPNKVEDTQSGGDQRQYDGEPSRFNHTYKEKNSLSPSERKIFAAMESRIEQLFERVILKKGA